MVENIDPNVIENMVGAGLQPTAYLKILTSYKNVVVQDNLTDTDLFQFFEPKASGSARE